HASVLLVVAALPISALAQRQNPQPEVPVSTDLNLASSSGVSTVRHPREDRLRRGKPFHGDLRSLPQVRPEKLERPEVEEPELNPVPFPGTSSPVQGGAGVSSSAPSISAPAPAASSRFEGLDFTNSGAGHPLDTNGDAGPQCYIQA